MSPVRSQQALQKLWGQALLEEARAGPPKSCSGLLSNGRNLKPSTLGPALWLLQTCLLTLAGGSPLHRLKRSHSRDCSGLKMHSGLTLA